jgi:DNA-binding transcriptional ArsR family regulator
MDHQPVTVSSKFYEQEADICKAFAHPARLHVLEFLGDQERTVSEIKRELNVSGPNLSQHLRILKAAGVLAATQRKGRVYCSCTSPEIWDLYCAMRKIVKEQAQQQQRWAIRTDTESRVGCGS